MPLGNVACAVSSPQVCSQIEVLVFEVPPPLEDVVGGLRVGGGQGGVSRGQAGEAFGVHVLVAVDQGRGDLLGHAFEEGFDLD